jgi:hypothetical protein
MTTKHPGRKQVGTKLDEELYLQVRSLALLQHRNAGEVIDDAIRQYLAAHANHPFLRTKPPAGTKAKS